MDAGQGDGHWSNLNSFLTAPEWVEKLYLGMVLQQAESEGKQTIFFEFMIQIYVVYSINLQVTLSLR